MTTDYHEWVARVKDLLSELSMIDFGYPIGNNALGQSGEPIEVAKSLQEAGITCTAQLRAFYEASDGLSWPGVQNGYFLRAHSAVGAVSDAYEVTKVKGHAGGEVVVLGSSGGGDLFAIRKREADILFLPAGRIEDNTYYDRDSRVRIIAPDVDGFVELLTRDLEAFIRGDANHQYIA
jgi:hypothetical protein